MGRVKGSTLLGAVKFLRSRRSEATALLPGEHRHYLDETVKTSAWYPLEDLLALVGIAADLLARERMEAFEFMGEFAARAHADLYGDLMRGSASPSRAFALWSTQFDAGRIHLVAEGPGRARVELLDFESPAAELCALISGYVKGVMTVDGISDVSLEELSCTLRGARECAWRATWKREEK